jgi:hypothetical protein
MRRSYLFRDAHQSISTQLVSQLAIAAPYFRPMRTPHTFRSSSGWIDHTPDRVEIEMDVLGRPGNETSIIIDFEIAPLPLGNPLLAPEFD